MDLAQHFYTASSTHPLAVNLAIKTCRGVLFEAPTFLFRHSLRSLLSLQPEMALCGIHSAGLTSGPPFAASSPAPRGPATAPRAAPLEVEVAPPELEADLSLSVRALVAPPALNSAGLSAACIPSGGGSRPPSLAPIAASAVLCAAAAASESTKAFIQHGQSLSKYEIHTHATRDRMTL